MKRKLFSFFLTAAVLCSFLSVPVFSEEITERTPELPHCTTGGYVAMEAVEIEQVINSANSLTLYNSNATEAEKNDAMFQELYQHILDGDDSVDVLSYRYTPEEFHHAIQLFDYMYPCAFLSNLYYTSVANINGVKYVSSVTFKFLFPTKEERDTARQAVLKEVEEILSLVDDSMSDLEKILLIHDALADRVVYDDEGAENSDDLICHNAYGALVEGSAVCQGYAEALAIMLNELGIPHLPCCSEIGEHIWNIVQIDGIWYHLDATWDDPTWGDPAWEGLMVHQYFLTTAETQIELKEYSDFHVFGREDLIPACTDAKFESGYVFNTTAGKFSKNEDGSYLIQSKVGEKNGVVEWRYQTDVLTESHSLLAQAEVDTTTTFSNMLLRLKNNQEIKNGYFYIAYFDASGKLTKTQMQAFPTSKSAPGCWQFYFTVDEQAIKNGSAKIFVWNGTTFQPYGSTAREVEIVK